MADTDFRGEPIDIGQLTSRENREARTAVLRTRMDKLESGTPTPVALGQLFDDVLKGGVGSADGLLALSGDMERRDPHYRAQLSVRKLAVGSVAVGLLKPEGGSEQAVELIEHTMAQPWWSKMGFDLLDGLGKSYSVCELHWVTDVNWLPVGYKYRDPRHFSWDDNGRLLERDPENADNAEPVPPFVYAVHEPHLISGPVATRGLAWPCAFWSMAKSFSIKDWMKLSEIFGIPLRIGKYDSSTTPDEKEALWDAMNDLGHEAAAIIHKGTEIIINAAGGTGSSAESLYRACIEVCDAQMSKAISGQTMTMDDGSSRSQSETHKETLNSFDETTAKGLVADLNRDVILPIQCLNFGATETPVMLYVPEKEDEDLERLVGPLVKLVDRGFRVTTADMRKKYGLSEPEDGDEVLLPISQQQAKDAVDGDGDGDDDPSSSGTQE